MQKGYGVKQQECFAIVAAVRRLKRINLPTEVIVRCDHGNLRWLAKQQDPWLMRWFYELASHGDIWFQHLPGVINAADFPSRIATTPMTTRGAAPELRIVTSTQGPSRRHVAFEALETPATVTVAKATAVQAASLAKARAAKAAKAAAKASNAGAEDEDNSGDSAEAEARPADEVQHPASLKDAGKEEEPQAPAKPRHTSDLPLALHAEPLAEPRFNAMPYSASSSNSQLKRVYDAQQDMFSPFELIKMQADKTFTSVDASPYPGRIWLKGDGRLVVPASFEPFKREILAAGHDQFFHGSKADLTRRTWAFWWFGKDDDIQQYIDSCGICQVMRAPQVMNVAGRPHSLAPTRPLHYIIIDHVPMQPSKQGFVAILTFADVCTRYQSGIPVRNMSALAALNALELYKTHFSLPRTVQTDDSTSFAGEFADYLARHNIEHIKTPAYWPQANGKGERPHKTLWDKLRAACPGGEWQHWDLMLPYVMEAINTQWHRGIHMTPYEALYGEPAYSLVDANLGRPQDLMRFDQTTYTRARETLVELLATRESARLLEQRHEMARSQPKPAHQYMEGEDVLLFTPRGHKGASSWHPGYIVKTVDPKDPDFYIISKRELTGEIVGEERVPVARLRPFNAERIADFGMTLDLKPDHGVVESIVGHSRNAAGDFSFRVKWAGKTGEHAVSTAGLQSLMRNCKETLLTYCQAQTPRIPWSRLLEQRKTHNKMLREQGITGRL